VAAAAAADSTVCLAGHRPGTLGSRAAPAAGIPAAAVAAVGTAERHSWVAGRARTCEIAGMGEWKVWRMGWERKGERCTSDLSMVWERVCVG